MKAIRNLIAAAALGGASFAAGTAYDNVAAPNDCNAPWYGVASNAPAVAVDGAHEAGESMLVCRHPDGSEATFLDSGRRFGYDATGAPLDDARLNEAFR